MFRRLPLLIALAAIGVGFAGAVSAAVGPLVLVSGPSPFAACPIGGPGTVYVNAEVEPFVVVNPANPNNIIGLYQQDRWDNGGAHGLVAAVTHTGGTTWTHSWAHFSKCSGGTDFERASDPWITFAPNGDAYQSTLALDGSDNATGVLVSKSTDGGDTWSEPVTLIRDASDFFSNDKESITADPTDLSGAHVYVVWDRSRKPGDNADPNALHSFAFRGDAFFSRTTDSGATWSAPRTILPTNANLFTSGNIVAVLPTNGTLVDVFELAKGSGVQPSPNQFTESVVRSTDKGATWSRVFDISTDQSVAVHDPDTGAAVRTGAGLPDVAVDPNNGTLYVVWADSRFSGGVRDDIALSKSTDGGRTWSTPIKVNQTPVNVPAFTPAVDVAENGTVAVTYYDFRFNTPDKSTLPTDYWIVYSTNGGVTWSGEQRITSRSFDMDTAPVARGPFVGDYEGLTHSVNTFFPVFVQTSSDTSNRTDVFYTTATP